MADISTTQLDADTDSPFLARDQILQAVQRLNALASAASTAVGSALLAHSGALAYPVGTAGRALNDRGVCITDYPYLADRTGVADATSVIQTAINDAVTNGHTLYIPGGTYKLTSTLTISGALCIVGDGYASWLSPSHSGHVIRVNASHVTIDNLRLHGSSGNDTVVVGYSGAVTDVNVTRCYFKGMNGVVIRTATYVTVDGCTFDGAWYGILQEAGYASSFVTVNGNTCRDALADFVEANCTSAAPSEAWTITNNIYTGANGYPTAATEKRFVGVTAVQGVIISGNNVQKCAGDAAIHLEDVLGNTIISQNIFDNIVCAGGNAGYIYLLNSAENVIITENFFFRSNSGLPLAYAVDTSSGSYSNDIIFANNKFGGGGGNMAGLSYFSQTGGLICKGNVFGGLVVAIKFSAGSNVVFEGNFCTGNAANIQLDLTSTSNGGADWLITGNQFLSTSGTYDIYTSQNSSGTNAPQRWTLTGNVFSKQVYVQGQSAGTGTQAANDIVITNNVFQASASLSTGGAMPRLVQFGNVFQATSANVTPTMPALPNYANDAAAATGAVPVGGTYRNGSVVQVRVS